MTDRKRLLDILNKPIFPHELVDPLEAVADYLLDNGVTFATDTNVGSKWISVEDRLPEPERIVQVCCRTSLCHTQYLCHAYYIPEKWLASKSCYRWEYESCNEYDEEADDYIVNSGWYERIYNWDDYGSVSIADDVTHWMPLPEPPKEEHDGT